MLPFGHPKVYLKEIRRQITLFRCFSCFLQENILYNPFPQRRLLSGDLLSISDHSNDGVLMSVSNRLTSVIDFGVHIQRPLLLALALADSPWGLEIRQAKAVAGLVDSR